MKTVCLVFFSLLLVACATPRPILDTATIVARMSEDMDKSVANYVESLKVVRERDAARLRGMRNDADRRKGPLQDQMQILTLVQEERVLKVIAGITVAPEADPLQSAAAPARVAATPITFDSAPLKNVVKITREIGTPPSNAEQLQVLLKFAKTVNDDLRKAADDNKKPQP